MQMMIPKSFSEEVVFIKYRALPGEERAGEAVTRQ